MGIKTELVDKFAALIAAAFGLIAALAWNSAIQQIFKNVFGEASNIIAMLSYAIFVTIIAVIATIWIAHMASKVKPKT